MANYYDLILGFFGGGVTVATALVVIPKRYIENYFEKQLAQAKAEIERFGVEHQIMFSHLHKQRAESIEMCYVLLQDVLRKGNAYTSVLETPSMGDKQARCIAAIEALSAADEYFRSKVIYLPEPLADRVTTLLQSASHEIIGFRFQVDRDNPKDVDHQAWAAIWEKFSKELPEALREIAREFRKLLDPSSSS